MSCEHLVMSYSTFPKTKNDALKELMLLGQPVNVARYDQQKYEIFKKPTEKQLSFFWWPEKTDASRDRIDYVSLPEYEKHIFIGNLKYQTLLGSTQDRSSNAALLPLVSTPELKTQIETRNFSETIHSRNYTHIIRNIANDPPVVFGDIVRNEYIIARAEDIACYYDGLIEYTQYYNLLGKGTHNADDKLVTVFLRELKKKLYLYPTYVNVLEIIHFYVSSACSFALTEHELMEGNAEIIKLIAHNETLCLTSTQHMLNLMRAGADDPEMAEVAVELQDGRFRLFKKMTEQGKEWAVYLSKNGSIVGLNKETLTQYVEYITNLRMQAVGPPVGFEGATQNPVPWINTWLSSDNVQVVPQKVEISSCLIGQIDSEVSADGSGDSEL